MTRVLAIVGIERLLKVFKNAKNRAFFVSLFVFCWAQGKTSPLFDEPRPTILKQYIKTAGRLKFSHGLGRFRNTLEQCIDHLGVKRRILADAVRIFGVHPATVCRLLAASAQGSHESTNIAERIRPKISKVSLRDGHTMSWICSCC